MGSLDDGSLYGSKEKKEVVFDPKEEFGKLSRESEELYGEAFSSNFVELRAAAEDFGDIDVERVKYLTLRTYREDVALVVLKFLKSMTGCKKACSRLEKKFREIVDLAGKYPELLKWERCVAEMNEIELRISDALVKLEKYKKMMPDVEAVVDAWPDTSYNPLKAVYQTAQRPIGFLWGSFIGERSVLNQLAARARYELEGVVHDFVMGDEHDITPSIEEAAAKVTGKVTRRVAKKAADFIDD